MAVTISVNSYSWVLNYIPSICLLSFGFFFPTCPSLLVTPTYHLPIFNYSQKSYSRNCWKIFFNVPMVGIHCTIKHVFDSPKLNSVNITFKIYEFFSQLHSHPIYGILVIILSLYGIFWPLAGIFHSLLTLNPNQKELPSQTVLLPWVGAGFIACCLKYHQRGKCQWGFAIFCMILLLNLL